MPSQHDRGAPLRRPPHGKRPRKRGGTRYIVARSSDLKPGESLKFLLPIRGTDEECFLINFNGAFHAYVNRCRHVPMALDWVDNQFFAEEGRYVMCQTHNAYYEPATGECIAGPFETCGKLLYRVPLEITNGTIYVTSLVDEFDD
ncbi:MAG TPA: Rieske 2Fe-2S domain-containing protein [Candidatus Binataceae bacterium]|jgi:nitrite reductase/ring-hydroxylating ferredoxin subunit|nr:Rieske 2Fe-2S domain-containing protein [Candidatus Binataceae bacterium]